jgi:type IV pilus assembly protein PilO
MMALRLPSLALKEPMQWPAWLRHLVLVPVFGLTLLLLWSVWLQGLSQDIGFAQQSHGQLQATLRERRAELVVMAELNAQLAQTQSRLSELELRLPGASDMNQVMSSLSRSAKAWRLQLAMIKPQAPTAGLLYEEQRLTLQLIGRFEDLGGFARELSALPWRWALHSFSLVPFQNDMLRMDMVLISLRSPHVKNSLALPEPSAIKYAVNERLRPAIAPGSAPFSSERLWPPAPLLAANVLARPAPGRARAPLQSEPLANMTLVGSLLGQGPAAALVRVKDRIYLVRVGDVLGLEEAQVAEISASRLMLYEHSSVPGANKVVQTRFMNLLEKTP